MSHSTKLPCVEYLLIENTFTRVFIVVVSQQLPRCGISSTTTMMIITNRMHARTAPPPPQLENYYVEQNEWTKYTNLIRQAINEEKVY